MVIFVCVDKNLEKKIKFKKLIVSALTALDFDHSAIRDGLTSQRYGFFHFFHEQ